MLNCANHFVYFEFIYKQSLPIQTLVDEFPGQQGHLVLEFWLWPLSSFRILQFLQWSLKRQKKAGYKERKRADYVQCNYGLIWWYLSRLRWGYLNPLRLHAVTGRGNNFLYPFWVVRALAYISSLIWEEMVVPCVCNWVYK